MYPNCTVYASISIPLRSKDVRGKMSLVICLGVGKSRVRIFRYSTTATFTSFRIHDSVSRW
jgi:hypothetical protein